MGKNEIRLRRHTMSSGRIAQHRNYGELMARHQRHIKMKGVIRALVYFVIIVFLILLYMTVTRLQKHDNMKEFNKNSNRTAVLKIDTTCST